MCLSKSERPSITDYVGTILNRAEYYHRIKHKDKRFEIKTYEVLGLPPWIIFHPSRDLRKVGIVVNLVARLHGPIGPFKTAKSAWKYCGGDGAGLGFGTRKELKAFMTRLRAGVPVQVPIWLYRISEVEECTEIVWIDSLANQSGFLRHTFCGQKLAGTRIHYADVNPLIRRSCIDSNPLADCEAHLQSKFNNNAGLRRLGAPPMLCMRHSGVSAVCHRLSKVYLPAVPRRTRNQALRARGEPVSYGPDSRTGTDTAGNFSLSPYMCRIQMTSLLRHSVRAKDMNSMCLKE